MLVLDEVSDESFACVCVELICVLCSYAIREADGGERDTDAHRLQAPMVTARAVRACVMRVCGSAPMRCARAQAADAAADALLAEMEAAPAAGKGKAGGKGGGKRPPAGGAASKAPEAGGAGVWPGS